uniref:Transcription factor E2F8 n=1 Tax=Sphenodon punctatus TaxID=8508 RepID=A0A8D0H6V5_SPHPU
LNNQSENPSSEPHKLMLKTPLKQAATSNSVLSEIQNQAGSLLTPPKLNETSPGDPWTPTANLKILISAASPEIRNREQKKRWPDGPSEVLEAKNYLHEHLSGDEYEKSQPSRKEKSLGLLCHKFLVRYPNFPNTAENNEICLDEVSEELNVERRRIYDIVNVLESLHMVSRLAKNRYVWHGRHNLNKTLQTLKKVGEENKYKQQIQLIKRREYEQEFELEDEKTGMVTTHTSLNTDLCFVELPGMEFRAASVNSRKDKSLRVMSQKFVMLFLVSTPQIVSLEVAAKILIGEDHVEDLDKSKFKTKIRRLYDIANVLSSLELIKKVHVKEERGRKPAFKWIGPHILPYTNPVPTTTTIVPSHSVECKSAKEQCSKNLFPSRGKQSFTRHPSLMKLVKTIESDRRKIHSAPSSPTKKTDSDPNPSSFPSKMAQLAAICKEQLEEPSRQLKKMKMKLTQTTMQCKLASPVKSQAEPVPSSSQTPSLVEPLGVLPVIHNSMSPAMLPHAYSGVSYAVYLHPSQGQTMTTYSPTFTLQCVSCANMTGIKTSLDANSKALLSKTTTEDGDSSIVKDDAVTEDGNFLIAKEKEVTKNDNISEKCLKRSQALLENSPIKKYKGNEKNLEDALVTLFPSVYLIPLAHCTQLGNEAVFYSKEKAAMCSSEPGTYSSSIAGLLPVTTSEVTAVNFPAFHITPLKLMVPPSSVATVPVANGVSFNSSPDNPSQSPSSSLRNFTLQHLGLISPGMQVSANPILGPASVHPETEHVSPISENVGLKHRKKLKNILPMPGPELEKYVPSTVPETSEMCQTTTENFFRTPGGPTKNSSLAVSSDSKGVDEISQGTKFVPQRKLEVSTEAKL